MTVYLNNGKERGGMIMFDIEEIKITVKLKKTSRKDVKS